MTTKYTIICLIVVFNFQYVYTQLSTRPEVESQLECTSKRQKMNLNLIFVVTNSSTEQNFSSFWGEHEQELKNQTVKRLLLAVINYPRNFSNTFSCYGNVTSYAGWRNNVTFNVQLPKVWLGSELLGLRFISWGQQRVEFYIKPKANINDIGYSVTYCWECGIKCKFGGFDFAKNYTCPRYRTVKFQCSHHEYGVYGIPNSVGLICKATTIDYIFIYRKFNFYIQTTTQVGSTSVSSNFRFQTLESAHGAISSYAEQGKFTVVLMGQKLPYLTIITEEQKATLQWRDAEASNYRINYLCRNSTNSSRQLGNGKTHLTIYDQNFAPHTLCQFCLDYQVNYGSLFSEPVCNTTRFPETSPSKPPTITCDANTCPTTTHDKSRAVTIMCKFPPEKNRNGLLNKLVINYWNDSSNSTTPEEFATTNLTLCKVTLTGLSNRHNYYAQMSVCNSKGCSAFSNRVSIAIAISLGGPTKRQWWPTVIIITIALIVIIIGIIIYVYRRLTKRKQSMSLEKVEEPNDYAYLEANSAHHLNEYDELPKDKDAENSFDNSKEG